MLLPLLCLALLTLPPPPQTTGFGGDITSKGILDFVDSGKHLILAGGLMHEGAAAPWEEGAAVRQGAAASSTSSRWCCHSRGRAVRVPRTWLLPPAVAGTLDTVRAVKSAQHLTAVLLSGVAGPGQQTWEAVASTGPQER